LSSRAGRRGKACPNSGYGRRVEDKVKAGVKVEVEVKVEVKVKVEVEVETMGFGAVVWVEDARLIICSVFMIASCLLYFSLYSMNSITSITFAVGGAVDIIASIKLPPHLNKVKIPWHVRLLEKQKISYDQCHQCLQFTLVLVIIIFYHSIINDG